MGKWLLLCVVVLAINAIIGVTALVLPGWDWVLMVAAVMNTTIVVVELLTVRHYLRRARP